MCAACSIRIQDAEMQRSKSRSDGTELKDLVTRKLHPNAQDNIRDAATIKV